MRRDGWGSRPCSLQGARRCHSRRARDSGERCGGGAEVAWAGESEGVWEEGVTLRASHRRPWLLTTMMSRPYFSSSQLFSSPTFRVSLSPSPVWSLVWLLRPNPSWFGCPVMIVGTKNRAPTSPESSQCCARTGQAQQSSPPRTFLERGCCQFSAFSAKPTAVPASLARPPPSAPLPLRAVLFRRIPTAPSTNSLCHWGTWPFSLIPSSPSP